MAPKRDLPASAIRSADANDGDAVIFATNGHDVSAPDPAPQANRLYKRTRPDDG